MSSIDHGHQPAREGRIVHLWNWAAKAPLFQQRAARLFLLSLVPATAIVLFVVFGLR